MEAAVTERGSNGPVTEQTITRHMYGRAGVAASAPDSIRSQSRRSPGNGIEPVPPAAHLDALNAQRLAGCHAAEHGVLHGRTQSVSKAMTIKRTSLPPRRSTYRTSTRWRHMRPCAITRLR